VVDTISPAGKSSLDQAWGAQCPREVGRTGGFRVRFDGGRRLCPQGCLELDVWGWEKRQKTPAAD
jgi:hypothetical protein